MFTPLGGVVPQYTGANDITDIRIQNLNAKYYQWLSDNNTTSTNFNIRGVAYLLDTTTWNKFKNEYAEYAIGGPTLELFFSSYNKCSSDSHYSTRVNNVNGYQFKLDEEEDYRTNFNPYWIRIREPFISDRESYWIASCMLYNSMEDSNCATVQSSGYPVAPYGHIRPQDVFNKTTGFRPIVCLNPEFVLEKKENAFLIIEQE